jgi:hypothetical protein
MRGPTRKPTPGSEPAATDIPEPPERWSASRKTELVLRLVRDEPLDAVSRESQVPAHESVRGRRVRVARDRAEDAAQPDREKVAMLEGRTRIPPVDVETLPDDLREVLEEQRKLRGAPLYPYLFYARNPAYFRAAQGMWTALQQHTKRVPGTLRALLNRRVAWWNGCEF